MLSFTRALVLASATVTLSSCGGSTNDSASVPSSPVDSSVGETASTEPIESSTSTLPVPIGLQLDQLPGRIAVISIGCGNGLSSSLNVICIYDPDGTDLIQVDVPGSYVAYPNWTWDGTKLLFDNDDSAWSVNADGTGLTSRDPYQVPMTSQSPDGRWSVGTLWDEDGFWLSPAGSPRSDRQWLQVTSDPNECCDFARWSSDSRRLLYSVGFGSGACGGLASVDIETRVVQVIIEPDRPDAEIPVCVATESGRWSPDDSVVLFLDEGPNLDSSLSRPMLVNSDGTGLRPLIPDVLANDPSILPTGWLATAVAWSPDGKAVAMALIHDMGSGLYMISADGSEIVEVTGLPIGAIPMDSMVWAPGL